MIRHLIVGFDGADLELIKELGPSELPVLHAEMERGAYAHQRSVRPEATLPNWATFLTGVDPGRHGVFDFTTRHGYSVRFTGGSAREVPTIFRTLDARGFRALVIGFPATYPPEPLGNGVFISGWDAPVAFRADASFVHPSSLHRELTARFGPMVFDDVDEFAADREGWLDRLPGALERRIERKIDLVRHVVSSRPFDVMAVYFGESDTASHYLMSLHDPRSPRRPAGRSPRAPSPLARVYRALDRALSELLSLCHDDVELTVVSDHGSGPSSDKVLYLNRILEDAGLLTFEPPHTRLDRAAHFAKQRALVVLPPFLRERIFRAAGTLLPSAVESRARFGGIDMTKTRAFSDELNYFPAVHFNVRGREPNGIAAGSERRTLAREVVSALRSVRDPDTGAPVLVDATLREDLYEGPYVDRAPDLVLTLGLPGGLSYNVMPSSGAPPLTGPFRRLAEDEHLGKKGRSLPGSHRARGLFVAAGPSVANVGEIDMTIADASATLLARMGVPLPLEASGRVLFEILTEEAAREGPSAAQVAVTARIGELAQPPVSPRSTDAGERKVIERLRALGYVE